MATDLIQCPHCGATPVQPPDATGGYVCTYCRARFRAKEATRAVPTGAPAPVRQRVTPPLSRRARTVIAVVGLLIAGGIGGILQAVERGAAPVSTSSGLQGAVGLTPLPTLVSEPAEHEVAPTATFEFHNRVSGYKSSYYVLGIVKNTSPYAIDKPEVTVVLHDVAGKEVGTRNGYGEADALAPGATTPAKVLISDPPAHDKLTFEVAPRKASYVPEESKGLGLEILEKPTKNFGSWTVSGKVANAGTASAKFVRIEVLSYDGAGKLIGVDDTFTDTEKLEPHGESRFRAIFTLDREPAKFSYSVGGRPDR
jgi:hypothetical protein